MSPKEFSQRWREALLDFAWRAWSALGVPGHAAGRWSCSLDPEALILFTCEIGRHDPRLFDEMLDWIGRHERLINVQRMATLLERESFRGGRVIAAVARFMDRPQTAIKWRRLAAGVSSDLAPEPLFVLPDGRPLPVVGTPDPVFAGAGFLRDTPGLRDHALPFDPARPETLLLKLRALFGVNSRAELAALLMTHPPVNASEAARLTGYFQRTTYNALVEMKQSGLVRVIQRGGEHRYTVHPEAWSTFLGLNIVPRWTNWPPRLAALESIAATLLAPSWPDRPATHQALDLHLLLQTLTPRLQSADLDFTPAPPPPGPDDKVVRHQLEVLDALRARVVGEEVR